MGQLQLGKPRQDKPNLSKLRLPARQRGRLKPAEQKRIPWKRTPQYRSHRNLARLA